MLRYVVFALFALFLLPSVLPGVPCIAYASETIWKAPPEAAERVNPVKADSASIKRGKALFIKYCSPCHGKEGLGDGPVALRLITEPPDLTALAVKQADGELAWKIAAGRNPMPKWQDKLSGRQIWDIVNFIQNLQVAADKMIP